MRDEAERDISQKLAAGMSPARISMGQARECYEGALDSLDIAWRNFRLAVRAFFFAIFCWMTGGCSEPVPPECQFYIDEIQRVEGCLAIGGCATPQEQDEQYRQHMESELEFCKARARLNRNALTRE